jgi:hypothetical protein
LRYHPVAIVTAWQRRFAPRPGDANQVQYPQAAQEQTHGLEDVDAARSNNQEQLSLAKQGPTRTTREIL